MIEAVGASVRGVSHARDGRPNQDAIGWYPRSGPSSQLVVGVADGHGSKQCFRSHVGSRLAVDAALDEGRKFLASAAADDVATVGRRALAELPRAIVRSWRQRVEADLARAPISEAELESVEHADGQRGRKAVQASPTLAYGATLLVAVFGSTWVLTLQVGDGDILYVSPSGQTTRPLSKDPRLIGNETTSLSASGAERDFRLAITPRDRNAPALVIAATDGLGNAYADDASFLRVGTDVLNRVREGGMASVGQDMEAWLESASSFDGDDVTVAIVALGPAETPVRESFEGSFMERIVGSEPQAGAAGNRPAAPPAGDQPADQAGGEPRPGRRRVADGWCRW